MHSMLTGIVKFYHTDKGWGFITPDDGGSDIFLHRSNIVGSVKEGDSVTYNVEDGPKGPKAVNVERSWFIQG